MKKYIPYIILVVATVIVIKAIDWTTDVTGDLEAEKIQLLEDLNMWKDKWESAEAERIKLQENRKVNEELIRAYETQNDSLINVMRNGTRAERDSTGAALIGRLRMRHNVKTLNERGLRPTR